MTAVTESEFELPTIEQVARVLAMCEEHDLPLAKLPKLWDEHTALQQVERRYGIQNGNMERELMRLRQLTHELESQLKDSNQALAELRGPALDSTLQLHRIVALEDTVLHYRDLFRDMRLILRSRHFAPELRLTLIATALTTVEPTAKDAPNA